MEGQRFFSGRQVSFSTGVVCGDRGRALPGLLGGKLVLSPNLQGDGRRRWFFWFPLLALKRHCKRNAQKHRLPFLFVKLHLRNWRTCWHLFRGRFWQSVEQLGGGFKGKPQGCLIMGWLKPLQTCGSQRKARNGVSLAANGVPEQDARKRS